jgi:hypothetical protein
MSNKMAVGMVLLFVSALGGFAQDPSSRDAETLKARRAKITETILRDPARR